MSDAAFVDEVTRAAEGLDGQQQQRVLAYIRSIKTRPPGMPAESFLRLAGTIPLSDCLEMGSAITYVLGLYRSDRHTFTIRRTR